MNELFLELFDCIQIMSSTKGLLFAVTICRVRSNVSKCSSLILLQADSGVVFDKRAHFEGHIALCKYWPYIINYCIQHFWDPKLQTATLYIYSIHLFIVHIYSIHLFVVHIYSIHLFVVHIYSIHLFVVHIYSIHLFVVHIYSIHLFVVHIYSIHLFVVHIYSIHLFVVHIYSIHLFVVHIYSIHLFIVFTCL